jgi:trafficking protein particle complex subunit 9
MLESPLGNEYLNATTFPMLPAASEMPKPIFDEPDSQIPMPHLLSYNSQPELNVANGSLLGKTVIMGLKRNSSAGPGMAPYASRQSTLSVATAKKRQSTIGATSSHGRLYKVLADFFLMAGRTEDASVW